MPLSEDLLRKLSAAHQEALRVHDSPLRADQLAATVAALDRAVASADDVSDEMRGRLRAALADAERTLRRDDDGREAARHLQSALRLAEDQRPRKPSPFLDD
jgi:ABC-type transporter Mla subunit MlaD